MLADDRWAMTGDDGRWRAISVRTVTSVLVILTAGDALAQTPSAAAPTIQVGPNVYVSAGLEARPLTEPHLAAHPADPNHLLGATIVSSTTAAWSDEQHCAAFLSLDGGRTWTRHDFAVTVCGDPWVALTGQGTAVFTVLASHKSLPDSAPQLLVFVSRDGGRTWSEVPQSLGRGHDHQTATVDRDGNIYVLSGQGWRDADGKLRWTVFVARARAGRSYFDALHRFVPSNLNINAEGLAVLSNGAFVVSYSDFQRNVDEFRRGGILERGRTWIMVSRDRGETFSVPLFVTEQCGRSWTFLAADTSGGPHRDRLYHVCPNRDATAIQLHRSADRGEQWSDPILVEPAASKSGSRTHPQVAVNPSGVLGVSWLDTRDDPSGRCYAPYFTASRDGGQTFLPPARVAGSVSCPDSTHNGPAFQRWSKGGDYFGFAAAADGRFHVLWPDARSGRFQTWTGVVTVNAGRE
jgi:hypothetical protein